MIMEGSKFFFYSRTQHERMREINKKMGNIEYRPNEVFTQGVWMQYTEINDVEQSFNTDSKLVAKGTNMQVKTYD